MDTKAAQQASLLAIIAFGVDVPILGNVLGALIVGVVVWLAVDGVTTFQNRRS